MIKFRLEIQPPAQVQAQAQLGIAHILSLKQSKDGNVHAAAALMRLG